MEETKTPKKKKEENQLELIIDQSIKKFDISDSFFTKLKKKADSIKTEELGDTEKYEELRETISIARTTKTSIEKKRKEIKEDSLIFGRAVDAEAKRLTNKLLPIYEELQEKKSVIDAEKEKAREEKRLAKEKFIQNRAVTLMNLGMEFSGIAYSLEDITISVAELGIITDKNFEKILDDVKEIQEIRAKAAKEALKKKELHEKRLNALKGYGDFYQEDELIDLSEWPTDRFNNYLADVVAKSIEAERLKKDEEEQRAKTIALTKERLAVISPLLKFSYAGEFQIHDIGSWSQDEYENVIAKLNEDKEAWHKEEGKRAEELKQAAIIKKQNEEREAKEKADIEKRMKEEKMKALLPDKKKLMELSKSIRDIKIPEVKTSEAIQLASFAKSALHGLSEHININIK